MKVIFSCMLGITKNVFSCILGIALGVLVVILMIPVITGMSIADFESKEVANVIEFFITKI